ncbi:hypothetical protein QJQ45_017264 [Haematococcus lacustris]|nr:hypothetical protein QJQ45_017264 [Haematococcus lacustris]
MQGSRVRHGAAARLGGQDQGEGEGGEAESSARVALDQSLPFTDKLGVVVQVVVMAEGGRGGNGRCAFFHMRGGRRKASGGDGGRGGSVVLQACAGLLELGRLLPRLTAPPGQPGGTNARQGAAGRDAVLLVPAVDQGEEWQEEEEEEEEVEVEVAAEVQRARRGRRGGGRPSRWRGVKAEERVEEKEEEEEPRFQQWHQAGRGEEGAVQQLVELIEDGQQVVVACGGTGGRGNASLAHAGGPPCSQATSGMQGQRVQLVLELRLLADVGLVGMPNAGKSSLLSALTAARAKLGAITFPNGDAQPQPQLSDQVGEVAHTNHLATPLVVADLPGLLAGAHENRGRGNEFLRHVQRVRCVAYVLDLTGGQPGSLSDRPPAEQLSVLEAELRAYQPDLALVPALVVANKVDACTQPHKVLAELMRATPLPIIPVSALQGSGLTRLKQAMCSLAGPRTNPNPNPSPNPNPGLDFDMRHRTDGA